MFKGDPNRKALILIVSGKLFKGEIVALLYVMLNFCLSKRPLYSDGKLDTKMKLSV
jgi:hypothetical protein